MKNIIALFALLFTIQLSGQITYDTLNVNGSDEFYRDSIAAITGGYVVVQLDRNGNEFQRDTILSSGDNIYTADGTLTGARTMTMGGNDLTLDGTVDVLFDESAGVAIGAGNTVADEALDVGGKMVLNDGNTNMIINESPQTITSIGNNNSIYGVGSGNGANISNFNVIDGWGVAANLDGTAPTITDFNVLLGIGSGSSSTFTGDFNTVLGTNAMRNGNYGGSNVALGFQSSYLGSSGSNNTSLGTNSFYNATITNQNAAAGYRAGEAANIASANSFFGNSAGISITASSFNTFVGNSAGQSTNAGDSNTGIGTGAGRSATIGDGNNFIGVDAGFSSTFTDNNTLIGSETNTTVASLSNSAAVGYHADITKSNQVVIGNANLNGGTATAETAIFGNTGIGTYDAVNQLDVEGGAAIGATYAGTIAAPANGLIVEGDVGIGTNSPDAGFKTHIIHDSGAVLLLENDNAGGDGRVQGWYRTQYPGAENNMFGINFRPDSKSVVHTVFDISNTAFHEPYKFFYDDTQTGPFYPLDYTYLMEQGGSVSIGSSLVPTNIFEVVGEVAIGTSYVGVNTAPADGLIVEGNTLLGSPTPIGAHKLEVTGTAGLTTGTAWTNISDIRLKDVKGNYDKGLDEIDQITPIVFSYKEDNPKYIDSDFVRTGFSAQEIQEVMPMAVTEGEDGYLELNTDPVFAAMVNAIKELKAQNEELLKRIEKLENK